jgi:anti-sigma B factor antagonist
MNPASPPPDAFTIECHGEITLIAGTSALETMDSSLIEQASHILLELIRDQDNPLIVIDLEQVDFFGSSFLALLLRCWKRVQDRGGMMALAGVSERARELLRLTALDTIWPIYAGRREAIEALLTD